MSATAKHGSFAQVITQGLSEDEIAEFEAAGVELMVEEVAW